MTEGAGAQAREDSHSTSGGNGSGVAGRAVPIDRSIGAEHPTLASAADVEAFEKIPYAERIAAASTYDAIRIGASVNPNAPAIQFLANASHEDEPVVINYAQLVARVTQTARYLVDADRRTPDMPHPVPSPEGRDPLQAAESRSV